VKIPRALVAVASVACLPVALALGAGVANAATTCHTVTHVHYKTERVIRHHKSVTVRVKITTRSRVCTTSTPSPPAAGGGGGSAAGGGGGSAGGGGGGSTAPAPVVTVTPPPVVVTPTPVTGLVCGTTVCAPGLPILGNTCTMPGNITVNTGGNEMLECLAGTWQAMPTAPPVVRTGDPCPTLGAYGFEELQQLQCQDETYSTWSNGAISVQIIQEWWSITPGTVGPYFLGQTCTVYGSVVPNRSEVGNSAMACLSVTGLPNSVFTWQLDGYIS
jgi:hypothetical protein